jgi:hypothetical protein
MLMGLTRADLRADCSRCVGLCCVIPAFSKSADFAIDKPAGRPCPNLRTDFRCGIHSELRQRGFTGCTVYDCFGAGQRAAASPETFETRKPIHELLWYVIDATTWTTDPDLRTALAECETELNALANAPQDIGPRWARVNEVLIRASAAVRSTVARTGRVDFRGADLIGTDLRRTDLRAATLRGAYAIGANLTGVDLSRTDLIGADLRGAVVAGADLRHALFVTQAQLDAARGDAATRVPEHLRRPAHWTDAR